MNIADVVKKQTDRILRQRQLNANAGTIIQGNPDGPPEVSNPTADLEEHKAAGDHDSRYYTEAELNAGQLDNRYYTETEVDSLLANLAIKYDLLTNGDTNNPEILFSANADVIWGVE